LWIREGKFGEAEAILRKLLVDQEKESGSTSPDLVDTLRGLGTACFLQVKSIEAEKYFKRAVYIQTQPKVKLQFDEIAYDFRCLGQIYLHQHNNRAAQEVLKLGLLAVDTASKQDAKPDKLQLELIELLARTYETDQQWERAESLLKRLHNLQTQYRETLRVKGTELSDTLKRLGRARLSQDDQAGADRYFQAAQNLERREAEVTSND
jgi:tetratricopeptide (TPR) repeat protein